MKKMLSLCAVLACLGLAGNAWAVIGWANIQWPTNGASVAPTGDVTVYTQVWKDGSTSLPGAAPDITGVLEYTTDIAAMASVPLVFNVDAGNNDENMGNIPQAALIGATWVDVAVVYTDVTDATTYRVDGVRYNVVQVLPVDVDVTFTMCMSGTPTSGAPCVIGGAAPIGNWGAGVAMNYVNTELWTVTVTFPAGSNPYFEYKYKADGCTNWEYVGNRVVTLPTDGTASVALAQDSFNNQPMGCTGQSLLEDKVLCFQVCMEGVDNSGAVCVIGNRPELTGWTSGVPTTMIGMNLYQACVVIPAGTPVPVAVEYKFKKDDCNTWEGVGNRTLAVDNASPQEQTLTSSWDDGPGVCAPVPTTRETWGVLKNSYR
jgi:hypothetical protein